MAVLFSNNAETKLASSISASDGACIVLPGESSLFNQNGGVGDYEVAVLTDGTNIEIVHISGWSGDTATILRGKENTTARDWGAGTILSARVTAGVLEYVAASAASAGTGGGTGGGSAAMTGSFASLGDITVTDMDTGAITVLKHNANAGSPQWDIPHVFSEVETTEGLTGGIPYKFTWGSGSRNWRISAPGAKNVYLKVGWGSNNTSGATITATDSNGVTDTATAANASGYTFKCAGETMDIHLGFSAGVFTASHIYCDVDPATATGVLPSYGDVSSVGVVGNTPYPETKTHGAITYDTWKETYHYTHQMNTPGLRVTFDALTYAPSPNEWIKVVDGFGDMVPGSPFSGAQLAGKSIDIRGNSFTIKYVMSINPSSTSYGFKVTNVVGIARPEYPVIQHPQGQMCFGGTSSSTDNVCDMEAHFVDKVMPVALAWEQQYAYSDKWRIVLPRCTKTSRGFAIHVSKYTYNPSFYVYSYGGDYLDGAKDSNVYWHSSRGGIILGAGGSWRTNSA